MRVMKTIDLLHDNITGLEIYQKYVIMFQLFKYLFFLMKEEDFIPMMTHHKKFL
jgi:hypothetical protein